MHILVDRTAAYNMGIILLARHPVMELGRERLINVWVTLQPEGWQGLTCSKSNIDLSILMAYHLMRNWQGQINLCMAARDEVESEQARRFMQELITLARLPGSTRQVVMIAPFYEALDAAPRADLHLSACRTDATCALSPRSSSRWTPPVSLYATRAKRARWRSVGGVMRASMPHTARARH